ncbi:MAG TPA: hypothetical protein VHU40_14200, partial [Polyangia bacterium]|nr:hypothetical protein [Polyangia bacterium]
MRDRLRSGSPSIGTVRAGWFAAALVAAGGGCLAESPGAADEEAAATQARLTAQGGDTTSAETTSALIAGTPKKTRTIAALMFNIAKLSDGTADPAGIPKAATISSVISGTGQSQRHMYLEASYGLQDLEADILGPYEL